MNADYFAIKAKLRRKKMKEAFEKDQRALLSSEISLLDKQLSELKKAANSKKDSDVQETIRALSKLANTLADFILDVNIATPQSKHDPIYDKAQDAFEKAASLLKTTLGK